MRVSLVTSLCVFPLTSIFMRVLESVDLSQWISCLSLVSEGLYFVSLVSTPPPPPPPPPPPRPPPPPLSPGSDGDLEASGGLAVSRVIFRSYLPPPPHYMPAVSDPTLMLPHSLLSPQKNTPDRSSVLCLAGHCLAGTEFSSDLTLVHFRCSCT